MTFEPEGEAGAVSHVTLPPRFQGYRDIAHGGVAMMLLDEIMAHSCRFAGERGMTASVELRFRKPVPLGVELVLHGRIKERRRNMLFLEATLALAEDDSLLATAKGTFVSTGRL